WIAAMRAPGVLDLAAAHVALAELAPETVADPERPRAVNASLQAAYARLAGITPAALDLAVAPYRPVARLLLLLGGAAPAHRRRLIQSLEADFPA
ncbi:MAG: hypothetical protein NW200_15110, partial [Hyphomonadaceae bacterium]|nr:hypothetical protein [Hyphomonadaceae bacterium]